MEVSLLVFKPPTHPTHLEIPPLVYTFLSKFWLLRQKNEGPKSQDCSVHSETVPEGVRCKSLDKGMPLGH